LVAAALRLKELQNVRIQTDRGKNLRGRSLRPASTLKHWRTQHVFSPCRIVWIINLSRGFLWQLGGSSELHVFLPFAAISRVALSGFGVNHHNHISLKKTKANQALFAVDLPFVFAGHSEVVPDCIASNEVKPVILDVQLALWFVPCEQT
jgi:hypothetical protein